MPFNVGAVIRLKDVDPQLISFYGAAPPMDDIMNTVGVIVEPNFARSSCAIAWHVIHFPELGKYARVRDDVLEVVG